MLYWLLLLTLFVPACVGHPSLALHRLRVPGSTSNNLPNLPLSRKNILYTQLDVGTPPRTFNVTIDSTTGDTYLSLPTCVGCNATSDAAYHPSQSSTSVNVSCKDSVCYTGCHGDLFCHFSHPYSFCDASHPKLQCTLKGQVFEDTFTLGGMKASQKLRFGGLQSVPGDMLQLHHIHGIMGIYTYTNLDNFWKPNPIQLLANASVIPTTLTALCVSATGGKLTLGGADPSLHKSSFQYAALTYDIMYYIEVKDITINGTSIKLWTWPSAVVDSSFPGMILPTLLFDHFHTTFMAYCAEHPIPRACDQNHSIFTGDCFPFTPKELSSLPPLTMDFKGTDKPSITVSFPSTSYLVQNDVGDYCLGLSNGGRENVQMVLGESVLRSHYTLYDIPGGRMGWADVDDTNC